MSRHYLRRMARRNLKRLKALQDVAAKAPHNIDVATDKAAARAKLKDLHITYADDLKVERTVRGPYRWRVTTG
ncbi:MAG: hypothetical protein ABW167_05210 [Baekduia sp.]